jgi:hypothetical protein
MLKSSHLTLKPVLLPNQTTLRGKMRETVFRTKRSRDHDVVVVRRTINLGTGNLERGGNGEGLGKGRSVYE